MIIDAIVVLIYFGIIISIGFAYRSREKTLSEYALGNRSIPWWAIVASILASEISAATFLGAPGEGYALRNYTYAQLCIGTILARILVARWFVHKFYEHNVVSIYEYLEIRFGKLTRAVGSFVFLITRSLASGTRLYVAAIFLVIGTELWMGQRPTETQELTMYVIALLVVVISTAIYTTIGGIKAVVWTDVIQATILFASLGCTLWILIQNIPQGIHGAMSMLTPSTDLQVFDTGLKTGDSLWTNVCNVLSSEYTIFAALLGSTFITLATHGTDQDMVQRMLTAKDPKESRFAVVLSGLLDLPVVLSFISIGILLWCFYQLHPDPHLPSKNPHIFPYFILTHMPAGLRGLLIAALLATAMGSLGTALNALATSFCRDFYIPYLRPQSDEAERFRAIKISTVVFAFVLIVIGAATAWVVVKMPGARILPVVLGAFGYTYGSLLGVFLVGLLTKRGSDLGNMIAMLIGFVVVALFSRLPADVAYIFGKTDFQLFPWIPEISFPWRIFFGSLTTFFVACLFKSPKTDTV